MNGRPRLLWIKADPLHPLNTGGKIRTYNMMVELKKQYEITFFTLGSKPSTNEVELYSDHQHWVDWVDSKSNKLRFLMSFARNCLFSSLPFVIDRYTTNTITDELRKVLTDEQFDFVVCDFLSLSGNLTRLPRLSDAPHVVFQHNVESRIWERHTETAGNFVSKKVFGNQWHRYLKYEKQACEWFDGVIAVSEDDAKAFREEFGLTNVLGDVPTGVDVNQFQEFPRQPKPGSLVFLGSMDWMPNIDGICDFVARTYPLIREKQPEATLTIVGRNPPEKVLSLAKSDSSITVTGTVDDVRPYLASGAVSIVPLRVGGGTRIKIFEAMAANMPVVSTTIGAEGLPVTDGHDIYIADSPEDFANKTNALLEDSAHAEQMAQKGFELVRDNFGWDRVTDQFVEMLESLSQKTQTVTNS